ncbi:MAG: iron ABC transporter permease [Lachnospiraceae bacterium]|nr:iron ABC transporter permease [Lachnospiraceae bacterium]
MKKRCATAFIAVFILLMIAVYVNLITGTVNMSGSEIFAVLTGRNTSALESGVIFSIRLPRIIAAVVLGGALALSGYMLQTFFDNPIVGPFVLGISSGAKLTVALALIFFLSKGYKLGAISLVIAAFIGAMAAMGFVLIISLRVKSMGILVVCGIMTGYICSAITDLTVTFADDSNIVNLHNWSLGSLSGINLKDTGIMSVIIGAAFIAAILMIKPIGAYRLGESHAVSLGVNIKLLRVSLILISSLLAATVTAFAGPISFVGIAVPHIMKYLTKTSSPAVMIPGCFMLGSLITLVCDGIARSVFAPTEVSISSVTAVLLVPVVIAVMITGKKRR